MDETSDAFAYRCLPLNTLAARLGVPVALRFQCADGGSGSQAIDIRCSAGLHARPTSIFGHGVPTFHVHGLFPHRAGLNLFIGGSPNQPKTASIP